MIKNRKKLNEIDKQMFALFLERLDIVKDIGLYKKANNIAILDQKREDEIIQSNLAKIENDQYKEYYQEFIKILFKISRDLQSK